MTGSETWACAASRHSFSPSAGCSIFAIAFSARSVVSAFMRESPRAARASPAMVASRRIGGGEPTATIRFLMSG